MNSPVLTIVIMARKLHETFLLTMVIKSEVGDKIDLILNLTTSYGTVEYVKNDISMGIAFSGVKLLGKLWFGVSSY
jgi:hypothetical protein